MSKFFISVSLILAMGLVGCNSNKADKHSEQVEASDPHAGHNHSAEDGHNHGAESGDPHAGHNHGPVGEKSSKEGEAEDGVIELSPADAQFLGVKSTAVKPGEFNDVIHVSGMVEMSPSAMVMASATSSGVVKFNKNVVPGATVSKGQVLATVSGRGMQGGDGVENAWVAYEAARKELERLRPLHADGIVSTREFNAAEAEYNRAKAAYSGAQSGSKVIAQASGIISDILVADGSFVDAGTPVFTIADGKQIVLRADVPARELSRVNTIKGSNIKFAGIDGVFSLDQLHGKRVSNAAATMKGGYLPVYFTIDNPGNLVGGMYADVYLVSATRNGVISVPVEALTEQQGVKLLFVQLDEDCYKKIPVTTGNSDGRMVEIIKGVNPGDRVVTEGAVFVKMAESKGAVPEGHSHSH